MDNHVTPKTQAMTLGAFFNFCLRIWDNVSLDVFITKLLRVRFFEKILDWILKSVRIIRK